ncbi:hypothetical protein SLE2022_248560 [Rubroshorea leprosula]
MSVVRDFNLSNHYFRPFPWTRYLPGPRSMFMVVTDSNPTINRFRPVPLTGNVPRSNSGVRDSTGNPRMNLLLR